MASGLICKSSVLVIDQRFAVTAEAVDRKSLELPPGEHMFEKTTKHADLCGEPLLYVDRMLPDQVAKIACIRGGSIG